MTERHTRVYIAGPMTNGGHGMDLDAIRRAIGVAHSLKNEGYLPYCPQLTLLWQLMYPEPYQDWLRMDEQWIPVCDVLLRLKGDSVGADREVECARSHHMGIFHSLGDLMDHVSPTWEDDDE